MFYQSMTLEKRVATLSLNHKANEEAKAVYHTDKTLLNTRVFYISIVFSNARRVLSLCNARLRLLYLLIVPCSTNMVSESVIFLVFMVYTLA